MASDGDKALLDLETSLRAQGYKGPGPASDPNKTGEEELGDLEQNLQTESGGAFKPVTASQDLFAKFPSISKFFNGIWQSVCKAVNVPIICSSLAYFEVAVILVVIVLVFILLKKVR